MDSLQLTHCLVRDFLVKQFGKKAASQVYKSKSESPPAEIRDLHMDLEALVSAGCAASLGHKRKIDGQALAGAKRPRMSESVRQNEDAHLDSTSGSDSSGRKVLKLAPASNATTAETSDDGSTSSEDDLPASGPVATSNANVIRNGLKSTKERAPERKKVNAETSSSSDDSDTEYDGDALKCSNLVIPPNVKPNVGEAKSQAIAQQPSSSDSSDVENGVVTGDPKSTSPAPTVAIKKGSGLMTPRVCTVGKQAEKRGFSKENVPIPRNLNRKALESPTTAGYAGRQGTAKHTAFPAEGASDDDDDDDSSSSDAAPGKSLSGRQTVEQKNKQQPSTDSSSEEEEVDGKSKVIHPSHSTPQTASLRKEQPKVALPTKSSVSVSSGGRLLNEKGMRGKLEKARQAAPQTYSSSDSSSDDESLVKAGNTKVGSGLGTNVSKKATSTSDESSSDEGEEEEVKASNITGSGGVVTKRFGDDDTSSSDSSSTEDDIPSKKKPLTTAVKKVEDPQLAAKAKKPVSSSSSDSSTSEDELAPRKKALIRGTVNAEQGKKQKLVEPLAQQAQQNVSSSSDSSSSEEGSPQSRKALEMKSKKVEQPMLHQKKKTTVVTMTRDVMDESSSSSSESVDELALQLKEKLAHDSFTLGISNRKDKGKGPAATVAAAAARSSSSSESSASEEDSPVTARTALAHNSNVLKQTAAEDVRKKIVTAMSKQTARKDESSSSDSSSNEGDPVPRGKQGLFRRAEELKVKQITTKNIPMTAKQVPQKDSSSADSSTSDEDILEKEKPLTTNSGKKETTLANAGNKRGVPLASKQNLNEVFSSSSSSGETSSDEDSSSTTEQQMQSLGEKAPSQSVAAEQKLSKGKCVEKKPLANKNAKVTPNKTAVLDESDTSDDSSSDEEESVAEGEEVGKATSALRKTVQHAALQPAVTHSSSSSSSSESSSEEDTVVETTKNVKTKAGSSETGKADSYMAERMNRSAGNLETSVGSKQKLESPTVNLSISKSEAASKKRKGKEKVLASANVSAPADISCSVMDSPSTNKKRKISSSTNSSLNKPLNAKGGASNVQPSPNALAKLKGGETAPTIRNTSSDLTKSAETVKNNSPYRRFTTGKGQLNQEFQDNSYQAKKGDSWGKKAYEDLAPVKGKNFRKEKTKKKRGTYKGGRIDPNVIGSIKFPDDDE